MVLRSVVVVVLVVVVVVVAVAVAVAVAVSAAAAVAVQRYFILHLQYSEGGNYGHFCFGGRRFLICDY